MYSHRMEGRKAEFTGKMLNSNQIFSITHGICQEIQFNHYSICFLRLDEVNRNESLIIAVVLPLFNMASYLVRILDS